MESSKKISPKKVPRH